MPVMTIKLFSITLILNLLFAFFPNGGFSQQSKHALLIGISQYPAPWPAVHGKEDVKLLEGKLKACGYAPFHIMTLTEKEATHQGISLQFRKLKEKVQAGDMVYIHFSGHFQRITDQNQDEDDGLDEAFVPFDALPAHSESYQGENHLLDEQIGGLLKQIQQKITIAGHLVLSFDGGFSSQPGASIRGTKQVFGKQSVANPGIESYDNELCDLRFSDDYRIAVMEPCSDCDQIPEVSYEGNFQGPLTSSIVDLIESGKNKLRVRDAEKVLKSVSAQRNLPSPKVDGSNKSMPFFVMEDAQEVDFDLSGLKENKNASVYAVVVGVSEYLNIPKLKYANADAYKFYRMLRHAFGKRLVTDSNYVFLDLNATIRPIERALRNVVDQVKEGDRVYIYFAGHGDVEENITKRGHLLLFDTPEHVYEEGSTLRVDRLKEYVMEYVSRKAQVFLVMDACHAGKLAGGDEGKSQNVVAIKELSTHSSKVLSCQPNEKSLESDVYGGGSGVFTFYLLEGLTGRANQDNNEMLTLGELKGYLSLSVGSATGSKQNPIVEGNARLPFMPLSKQAHFISDIKPAQIQLIASRSIAPVSNTKKDSLKARLEQTFLSYLSKGQLVEPKDACAQKVFNRYRDLFANDIASVSGMKTRLVDALALKTQEVVNNYIKAAEGFTDEKVFALAAKEGSYLQNLVGFRDPQYFQYQARTYFFEARALSSNMVDNDLARPTAVIAINNLKKAARVEPGKANIHNALGRLYFYTRDYDSAVVHLHKAHSLAPTWRFPINNLGATFDEYAMEKSSKAFSDSAIKYLSRVVLLYPDYALAWKNLGKVYENRGKNSLAKSAYKNSIFKKVDLPEPYINLGTLYMLEQKWDSSQFYYSTGLNLHPNNPDILTGYGGLLYEQSKAEPINKVQMLTQAIKLLTKSYSIDSNLIYTTVNLANTYWEKLKYDSAAIYYDKCIRLDTLNTDYREYEIEALLKAKKYDIAMIRAKSNQVRFPQMGAFIFHEGLILAVKQQWKEGARLLKKGLEMGYRYNTDIIESDTNLKAFLQSTDYKQMKHLFKRH